MLSRAEHVMHALTLLDTFNFTETKTLLIGMNETTDNFEEIFASRDKETQIAPEKTKIFQTSGFPYHYDKYCTS